jgi:hypothetical protein
VTLVLIVAIITFSRLFYHGMGFYSREWYQQLIFTLMSHVVVFTFLRRLKFRLERSDINFSRNYDISHLLRFSIRNLLIWSAALAPVLIIGRTVDVRVVLGVGQSQLAVKNVVLALSLTVANLCVCWLMLGTDRIWCRLVVTAVASVGLGYANNLFGDFTVQSMPKLLKFMGARFVSRDREVDWVQWFCLSAALLAALLIFFRASGYRLTRSERRHNAHTRPGIPCVQEA